MISFSIMNPNPAFEKGFFHRIKGRFSAGEDGMDGFLTLAGQLFLILCIQLVLEAMAAKWQNGFIQKPIELGCYLASLAAVLRYMEGYLLDIFRAVSKFF